MVREHTGSGGTGTDEREFDRKQAVTGHVDHTPANTTDRPTTLAPTGIAAALAHAAELVESSIAPTTRRAYAADWRAFVCWTETHGREVSPALPVGVATCAAWFADMEREGVAVATIRRRARGLAHAHREAGLEAPTGDATIRRLLAGITRTRAAAGDRSKRKRALMPSMVRAALAELSTRDRAIVLVALVTGLRRSELAALRWADVEPTSEGLLAWVRRSKTDQAGEGRPVAVPRGRGPACPVRALRDLRTRREVDGEAEPNASVFGCEGRTIARVIKRVAELAGEDPRQFGAHSARAGMMTTASEAGVDLAGIMGQSGHASTSVALGYIRPAEQARNPAARAVVNLLVAVS
jgi:integrase